MVYTVSITSQGQISIPAKIRRQLGLDKRKKALVSVENNQLVVKPVKDFFELAGSIKTDKKPLTNKQLDEFFGEHFKEDIKKKK